MQSSQRPRCLAIPSPQHSPAPFRSPTSPPPAPNCHGESRAITSVSRATESGGPRWRRVTELIQIGTTDNRNSYTATNLRANTAYQFAVIAVDPANNQSAARTVTFTTAKSGDTSAPARPESSGLKAFPFPPRGSTFTGARPLQQVSRAIRYSVTAHSSGRSTSRCAGISRTTVLPRQAPIHIRWDHRLRGNVSGFT